MTHIAVDVPRDLYTILDTQRRRDSCSLDNELARVLRAQFSGRTLDGDTAQEAAGASASLSGEPADHFAAKRASIRAIETRLSRPKIHDVDTSVHPVTYGERPTDETDDGAWR